MTFNKRKCPIEFKLVRCSAGWLDLILDFEKLSYISSAGLRVLLSAQKVMAKTGKMKILHANESIMEIFEITGFSDILNIE